MGRVRDAAMEALDRTGALPWISRRSKPRPSYGTGAFSQKPARLALHRSVGSLFTQPDRLDDRLGSGWAAVTASPAFGRSAPGSNRNVR